jgi:hypothetical protein
MTIQVGHFYILHFFSRFFRYPRIIDKVPSRRKKFELSAEFITFTFYFKFALQVNSTVNIGITTAEKSAHRQDEDDEGWAEIQAEKEAVHLPADIDIIAMTDPREIK